MIDRLYIKPVVVMDGDDAQTTIDEEDIQPGDQLVGWAVYGETETGDEIFIAQSRKRTYAERIANLLRRHGLEE
jgi:hypothetical protein